MLNSKTIMGWNVPATCNGNPEQTVQWLIDNNFEGICLKGADGNGVFKVSKISPWPLWGENIKPEMVDALKEAKLKIFIWHMLYGIDPTGELNAAISQASKFEPDGWIWDVETKFDDQVNAVGNARYIANGFRKAFCDMDQGLCWWALPKSPTTGTEWHPIKVALAFMEFVDVGMPMMYWQGIGADAAVEYLYKSLRIWKDFWTKPYMPIGRAYNGDGGFADAEGILAFANELTTIIANKFADVIGVSWWNSDKVVKNKAWEEALALTPKFEIEDPVKLSLEEKVNRLVEAHKELFPELFP